MFFCLICEQVGCSTPPPPSCNENETRVKIMFIVRPPSHCAPQKYKIQIQCTMWQEEGHITTGSQPAVICFPLAWFCFFFSVFLSLGVLGPVLYFGCFPTASRELPNCCNLARYYIYCLPDNYDDYL